MTIVKKVWRIWLKFAELLGTMQMVLILSIIYWLAIPVMAIVFKAIADPLALRSSRRSRWVERHRAGEVLDSELDSMKRQY